jgi:hypothetical protein
MSTQKALGNSDDVSSRTSKQTFTTAAVARVGHAAWFGPPPFEKPVFHVGTLAVTAPIFIVLLAENKGTSRRARCGVQNEKVVGGQTRMVKKSIALKTQGISLARVARQADVKRRFSGDVTFCYARLWTSRSST